MHRYYRPFHSDFLIHWTGIDIERKYNNLSWTNNHSSTLSEDASNDYLERLKYILKYGLWLTVDESEKCIEIKNKKIERPYPPRVCFTELKLSYVRSHAADFGRLGIGFKRFYVFNRLGGPMYYYQLDRNNWFINPIFNNANSFKNDEYYSCFIKPMTIKSNDSTLKYKYYDESEWRIIYSQDIAEKLKQNNINNISSFFKRPTDIQDPMFQEYIKKSEKDPEYLMSIRDKWFAMIIYPCLSVKVKAENDEEIRQLLNDIKPKKKNLKATDSNPVPFEIYSKPIEMDLDACRNY